MTAFVWSHPGVCVAGCAVGLCWWAWRRTPQHLQVYLGVGFSAVGAGMLDAPRGLILRGIEGQGTPATSSGPASVVAPSEDEGTESGRAPA